MKIKIVKKWKTRDIGDMLAAFDKKYGTMNSLQQKVLISKCTSPELMNDYVLWKNLSQGAEFQDIIIVKDPDIFDTLSPKRVEMLEFLMNNEVKSIRHLSTSLRRNYKNVYDDLNALSKYGLVDLTASGRALRPSAAASRIEVSIDA
ncbi:MAG: hypothetical protein KKH41_07965 [Candidatus Thermoplasmatota archaeon]|nr:hypothetical protein [Euryarchaeota archaeon]MBU4032023.1 hypothetical protein [Candidatus Thermoplasmatota archaeon]MBU4071628.1 hypothetical protein [Candidatus Thermoplasmatota archaeon]MBU4143888.1 hypothetical protein [Candidatus Thermoplasmatota archaeon]MBU4592503.1 hypothetical protein [Candidatus Thermoplasmatota archaeon]